MGEMRLTYRPPATLEAFHADDSFLRGVLGPVGSGKSVGMCLEIFFRSLAMPPSVRDNIRKSRWGVIRNTYGELKSTTIKTWEEWMPMSPVIYDTPIRWRWKDKLPDGTGIDLEVLFLAMNLPKDLKKLKSLEVTGIWVNEAVELSRDIFLKTTERVGRFPQDADVPKPRDEDGNFLLDERGVEICGYWNGVIADTNACDEDHWWFKFAEVKTPKGWRFWRQPPALVQETKDGPWVPNRGQIPGIPIAENWEHQPKGFGYWLELAQGQTDDWIKVFCGADYGTIVSGKPVYPEYNDRKHLVDADKVVLNDQCGLGIGIDFGLTPACCFFQLLPSGYFQVVDELVVDDHARMGIRQFTREVIKPHIRDHYMQFAERRLIYVYGDPAGKAMAQTDERTALDILHEELNSRQFEGDFICHAVVAPARTNAPKTRQDAVKKLMITEIDGVPMFRISSRCKMLRKGFLGKYHYERIQVAGDERYKDVACKNIYSHVQDGLQYGALTAWPEDYRDPALSAQTEFAKRIDEMEQPEITQFDEYEMIMDAIQNPSPWEEAYRGDVINTMGDE